MTNFKKQSHIRMIIKSIQHENELGGYQIIFLSVCTHPKWEINGQMAKQIHPSDQRPWFIPTPYHL